MAGSLGHGNMYLYAVLWDGDVVQSGFRAYQGTLHLLQESILQRIQLFHDLASEVALMGPSNWG